MSEIRTGIDEAPVLETSLQMPYTLTTGRAASIFLSALRERKLVGSRCASCERTVVPAQDFCTRCGGEEKSYVELPAHGSVTALTRVASGTVATIRIDGADADLLHRLDETAGTISIGDRVTASWASDPSGTILDIEGFTGGAPTVAIPAEEFEPAAEEDRALEMAYSLELPYRHSYGPHYGRLFDELGARSRLLGSKCPSCSNVLVPPRAYCDVCYVKTEQFVDVKDTGRLQAYSVIHMEFVGQTRKPPYVYAEIVLDGSATRLIHSIDGIDVEQASELLSVGMPVRAVWRPVDERNGTLNDIHYFEPIAELVD